MFGAWNNIAKSAEAVVSRWALKRLFKFLLKKKLGQFIVGDIDLDQLDVQLTDGTIQLSDLALNVDYLNQKFGPAASLVIKEGSIGSLMVKMPWKGKGCEVEVDELEILLVSRMEKHLSSADGTCSSSGDVNYAMHDGLGKVSDDAAVTAEKSDNVHEGVKTIAKMVKWFLTSFTVKIKKLIVAFDPSLVKNEKAVNRTLVLRISETECGTCLSEDADLVHEARAQNFLGISHLTNFVKFRGAILELLHMEEMEKQFCIPQASGMTFPGLFSDCLQSNATTPIISGKKGGFSGNLKLSIPWKNGPLDIREVDADITIDPIVLRLQPSTIKWLLSSWEAYQNVDKAGRNDMYCETDDSVYFNSNSQLQSSMSSSAVNVVDKVIVDQGSISANCTSLNMQESIAEAMLPGSHLIPNWVPISGGKSQRDFIGEEVDLGESMDQFFECFDGMRSSQSALGNSVMWNWTCSVFSAITAASNLASGSLHMPSDQQHVQTNLRASFAGVSIMLSFHDDVWDHLCNLNGNQIDMYSHNHYWGIECKETSLVVQVCSQKMRFEGKVKHVEAADYFLCEKDGGECSDNTNCQTYLIRNLQDEIQHALPPFSSSPGDGSTDEFHGLVSDILFRDMGNLVKIVLFTTSGITHFQCTMSSSSLDGHVSRKTSFSLKLPPLIFWFNFCAINALCDLLREVGKSIEIESNKNKPSADARNDNFVLYHSHVNKGSGPNVTTSPSVGNLCGNISISNARLILCFPFEGGECDGGCSSWDEFIVLDVSLPSVPKGEMQDTYPHSDGSLRKQFSSSSSRSLHLNMGNLCLYLVRSADKDGIRVDHSGTRHKFSAQKILSVDNKFGYLSVISMFWQEGPVTGPWIAKRAKSLATLEENGGSNKFMGKGYEFASVTTLKDVDDINSQIRQEIILSTAFFIHINLFHVTVDLDNSTYRGLHTLLNQIIAGLSCLSSSDAVDGKQEHSTSQTSVYLECDSLEISIRPDFVDSIKGPMQSELPGSWDCLKLKVQKFDLLSVLNIGGITDSNFLWLTHHEGTLWGSVSEVQDQEFLLISCTNSTMKRGDGGGSNVLSSIMAGSNIVLFWDPESCQEFTSITVRCSTVVAVGGRLDWMDLIPSFFVLPTTDSEQAVDNVVQKRDLETPKCQGSFVLKLIDVAVSYEPHKKNLAVSASESAFMISKEDLSEPYVACLLAASSLSLSNTGLADSVDNEYKIRVQDLGLLLCSVSECNKLGGDYSVEQLNQGGYVKVAGEALVEAVLKTNCKNSLLWEVVCSKSQIYLETCHDTTSGLVRLASQLQQLFAPDLEESIMHLQARWNNFQQAQQRNDDKGSVLSCDTGTSTSQILSANIDLDVKHGIVGLMDEICEDAFHLDGSEAFQFNSSESEFHIRHEESVSEEAGTLNFEDAEMFYHDSPVKGVGIDSSQASFVQKGYVPEFIESYCLSERWPHSKLCLGIKSSQEVLKYRSIHVGEGDLGRGNCGWYEDSSLSILENHIPESSQQANLKKVEEGKLLYGDCLSDDMASAIGRVLLENISVRWRMYAGSDWCETQKHDKPSKTLRGRDKTVCLELAVSGMEFQYDIFPAGGISASKLSLSIRDFHVYDESINAPWKLMLGYYDSKDHPRDSSSMAFKLDLEAVRPDPLTPLEEYRLRVAFLPILLHLHQSQLDFLIRFFGERSSSIDQPMSCPQDSHLMVRKSDNLAGRGIANEALLPYFQKFDVWPILVRFDYSPRHVDLAALRGGNYVELVNIVPWKGVELQLKHVHAAGVYGWGSVCETTIGEWLEDISKNQIHKVLRGLPTIRSLFAVASGASKLVSSPLESYRKDQKVLKGMQRGTIAFLRSISLEAVGLGVHLAAGTRDFLLQAEYMVTSIPSPITLPSQGKAKTNVRHNQPRDAQQGIKQAYQSISDGLEKSASALVQMPLKKYQRGASAGSALATAVRAVPTATIAPASACASAVHCALLGIRNSLDPERKKESREKYFGPSLPQDQN